MAHGPASATPRTQHREARSRPRCLTCVHNLEHSQGVILAKAPPRIDKPQRTASPTPFATTHNHVFGIRQLSPHVALAHSDGSFHGETDTLPLRTENWRRWLDGGQAVTVTEFGGQIIGFAMTTPARTIGEHEPSCRRTPFSPRGARPVRRDDADR